jgi:NAD(P)-dependent dehydrogenase (short-subunit alcohol dehydrogenase family)
LNTLEGKCAVVTGAGGVGVGGLGVVYAWALAAEGARVVVADVAGADHIASELSKSGHQALGVNLDVRDEAAVEELVQAAESAFGPVEILINNAGLARGKWSHALNLSFEEWIEILGVNTVAPLLCARACRPSMIKAGGGCIVNQSSMAAYGEGGAYSVSKLALVSMTNVLATELAPDNIRVNAIGPGMMTGQMPEAEVQAVLARQRIPRRGRPEDLVGLLLYLCSDQSSFVTGQMILVDGGAVRGRV